MKTNKLCPIKNDQTNCLMEDCALYLKLKREGYIYINCCFSHIAELLNLICMEMRGSTEEYTARYLKIYPDRK